MALSEEIARVENPSRALFEEKYVSTGTPVIVRGVASNWKAFSRWSTDYFRSPDTGKTVIPVETYTGGDFYKFGRGDGHRRVQHMELRKLIELLQTQITEKYYAWSVLLDKLPTLMGDVERPTLFSAEDYLSAHVFIGSDSITPAHYHPFIQAFLCQVIGNKEVTLYRPEDTKYLYPLPFFSTNFNWSKVNFSRPDEARFPKLASARPIKVVLEKGEMLFIPIHWWHLVEGPGFTTSVTFYWKAHLQHWHLPTPGLRGVFPGGLYNKIQYHRGLQRLIRSLSTPK
ncbi:hypothetical protein BH11MYX1_BH11MYX1_12560 [soil metagenome]